MLAAVLASVVGAGVPLFAQEPALPPATAHITYLAGASVYLDAGRLNGIAEGDTLVVVREGRVVATLRAEYVSGQRVSASIVQSAADLRVGDEVRYTPRPGAGSGGTAGRSAPASSTGTPAAGGSRGGLAAWGLHGRAGVRYLEVRDRSGNDNGFSQPALDLLLNGTGVGGSDMDLAVDVRAYRTSTTTTTGATQDADLNRIYRLSMSYRLDERQRITVGRQFASAMSVVSLFDGVLYDVNVERHGWGAFAGYQPDAADYGFSGDIREYGGYYQFRGEPGSEKRWSLTTGIVGSYDQGEVNREFLYLQGQYSGKRLTMFVTEEVDYNRDWKVDVAGEDTISPTSTFANLQIRAGERVTLYAGYDNRRNVRLYRDRVTPVTQFDDSYRQGAWAGASFRIGDHVTTGANLRTTDGGPAGDAEGYGVHLGVDRLTRLNFGFHERSTHFENLQSDGWLHTLSIGADCGSRAHLELSRGLIEETFFFDPSLNRDIDWTAIDLDLLLGRRWYLVLSGERSTGSGQDNDQLYTSLTWRF